MRIAKFVHSCLLIESNGDQILIDPGKFSFVEGAVDPRRFNDLSAIVLTHYHPDHIDDQALQTIVRQNRDARVLANSEIAAELDRLDIDVDVLDEGERSFGAFHLEAVEARHSAIVSPTV